MEERSYNGMFFFQINDEAFQYIWNHMSDRKDDDDSHLM